MRVPRIITKFTQCKGRCVILGMFIGMCLVVGALSWLLRHADATPEIDTQPSSLVTDSSYITPEGYIVYITPDMQKLRTMCAAFVPGFDPDGVVFGCSLWRYEVGDREGKKHDPKGPCLAVTIPGKSPDGEDVLQHELRHCKEGFFHE